MVDPAFCQKMAAYNRWQNTSLTEAASALNHEERWLDRGAFFKSIAQTFNHLLWDDALWLARFKGNKRPEETIDVTLEEPGVWSDFLKERQRRDHDIITWAKALREEDLAGDVHWYPAGGDTLVTKPAKLCAMHFFNHQTHHRGQIHAMLTAAGARPDVTDLPMLPE